MIKEQQEYVENKLSPVEKMRYYLWRYERFLNQALSILQRDIDAYIYKPRIK